MVPVTTRTLPERVAALSHALERIPHARHWPWLDQPSVIERVARFLRPPAQRLSRPALETLAVIAYRQPVTQPELEAIRGVNSSGVVKTLLERGLIMEKGRKETVGRPILYVTTDQFLKHFGLKDLTELPLLEESLETHP